MKKSPKARQATRAELAAEVERLRRQLDDRRDKLEQNALRQAQGEVEASRERFVELYDFAPVGYLTLDHSGLIRTLNLPAAELLGYPRAALVGHPLLPRIAPPDRRRFLSHLSRLRRGQAQSATEVELLRREQPPVTVQVISVAHATEKSPPIEFRTALVDMTERKRAERELRESAELNRRTLEALPAHIAVVDRQGRIVAVNQAWAEFARRNEAGGLATVTPGANYCEVCRRAAAGHDDSAAQALAGIEDVLRGTRAEFTMEYPCHSPQQQRWFLMTVVPCGARGEGGAVLTHLNITARKMAEERVAVLGRLGLRLSAAQAPADVARALVDTALEFCGWDNCFVQAYDPETDTVTDLLRMDTIEGQRVPVTLMTAGRPPTPLMRRVMREGPQLILRQGAKGPGPVATHFGDASRGSLSLMFAPVRLGQRQIGVLSVQSCQREAYTPPDLEVLQGLANYGAVALARVQAETALRQLNEELEQRVAQRTAEVRAGARYARSLIEASLDALVTISPAGKITDVNEATELLTGVPRARLIGSDFSGYFTEPDKAAQGYQKVLAEGLVRDYPLTVRHITGRVTAVLYHATVYRNDAGEVQGVLASARDITERRQAERRREFTNKLLALFARKSSAREYLEAAVAAIREWSGCEAVGVRLTHEQGTLPYFSCAGFPPDFLEAESQLSLHRDDCCCIRAIKQDFAEQDRALVTPGGSYRCDNAIAIAGKLPPEQQARYGIHCVKSGFASLAALPVRCREEIIGLLHLADRRPGRVPAGQIEFLEAMTPLLGEAVRWYQTEAKLAQYRDHLEELVKQRTSELEAANAHLREEIAHREVAEQSLLRLTEELKRSNLDLEQFAYVASHDLQEPLRAVGGYVRLLEHRFPEKVDDKTREYIAGAAEGAVRMERLIMDLLALSRINVGGRALELANLGTPLDAALHTLQFTIRTANANVTHDPLPTLPVDESQMVQLFQNLIANALKFHSEHPPQIHVGARPENSSWVISVRDNGIGIEAKYFERIFQVFQRLHTRTNYPGTGVGLAICKKIIQRHGGRIWVESQPGQGTTFFFSLPK